MKALFEIKLDGRTAVSESQLSSEFEQWHERLAALDDPEGGVLLVGNDGQVLISFGDDLISLVNHLCIEAVSALLEGKPFRFNFYAYPESLELELDGDVVQISGSDIQPCEFPRNDLLSALTDCGERFVHWMVRIADAGEAEGLLGKMQHAAAENRVKLESAT